MDYLLAHDLGTSGNKAVLYGCDGRIVAEHTAAYPTAYPMERAAEQQPERWWQAFCACTRALLEAPGVQPGRVLALSFSAQMNACLPVDAQGSPLRPAMIWADQRGGEQAKQLIQAFGLRKLHRLSGQRVGASSAIAKMMWFKQHEPELYARTACFLQAKDYIACRLTGSMQSDFSDASHLGCLDIRSLGWSADILGEAGIDPEKLPSLKPSTALAGRVTAEAAQACGLMSGTPVVLGGGDGPCATAGAGVHAPGQAYLSLGTSGWLAALRREPVSDEDMCGFNLAALDGQHVMSLGAAQNVGYALEWAIGLLCPEMEKAQAYARLAQWMQDVPPGSGGLQFIPHLLGERSPWWNDRARGCFLGLTARQGREAMLRSVMEGVGYTLRLILDGLQLNPQHGPLKVVGGGGRNAAWLSILADQFQCSLQPATVMNSASSLGAALCAGIGAGVFRGFEAAEGLNPPAGAVAPNPENQAIYEAGLARFTALYRALEPLDFGG